MPHPHLVTTGMYVVAECGHLWIEHAPADFRINPAQPRVCIEHRHEDCPASLMPSPQGMATVRVFYLDTKPTWWPR